MEATTSLLIPSETLAAMPGSILAFRLMILTLGTLEYRRLQRADLAQYPAAFAQTCEEVKRRGDGFLASLELN